MQINSKLHSTTSVSSFLCNTLKAKFCLTIKWKMILKTCFCEVYQYSNAALFGGIKTIQWEPACPAWLSAFTRSGVWYLFISVHFLSLLTKAFRWDISAVSPCSFERRVVNCHFELIQYCQQPVISGRQITSPVFTHPVVSEPCPLCSETIHSSYTEFVRRQIKQSVKCWHLTPIWGNLQLCLRIVFILLLWMICMMSSAFSYMW